MLSYYNVEQFSYALKSSQIEKIHNKFQCVNYTNLY